MMMVMMMTIIGYEWVVRAATFLKFHLLIFLSLSLSLFLSLATMLGIYNVDVYFQISQV
jgi:hypothetical protein